MKCIHHDDLKAIETQAENLAVKAADLRKLYADQYWITDEHHKSKEALSRAFLDLVHVTTSYL